jgi:transcriptional regulator of acetoin/glycerol metabolism
VRAILDASQDEIAVFDHEGRALYLNARVRAAEATAGRTPPSDGELRASMLARRGRILPLDGDGMALGELVLVACDDDRPWAHREHDVIREALARSGGKRGVTARELGISRTTLWRRLREDFKGLRQ